MYLRLNTKFNPFTYDELVKPLADYGKAYKEVEEAYSTLSEQTEAFKDEVNQANSPEAYEMYKQYSDVLNTVVDDFSQGMTGANRAKLLGMKRDYARSIVPIAKASEAMKEANAMRDKAGPDAIFEVNRYKSLDDFLGGKTANNRYQSASALTSKTAAITEAVMKEALQDPEFKKILDNQQQYMLTQHNGGSYEDLMAAITNNPEAQNKFIEIKKRMMQEAGYDNFDAYGKASIESAINTGLYAGLDKPVRSTIANGEYVPKAQRISLGENFRQFNAGMTAKGYTPDGEINKNSLYWPTQGIYFRDGNNGITQVEKTKNKEDSSDEFSEVIGTGVLTFEATSAGASTGYQKKSTKLSSLDTDIIKWSDIHGEDAKNDIKKHIAKAVGYKGDITNITDDMIQDIANFIIFERDQDWFSDNHFRVRIRGLSPSGGIDNKDELSMALSGIRNKLTPSVGLTTSEGK